MKNYNEVANDVFRRRDEYEEAKFKQTKSVKKVVASAICFCLVVLISVGVWQSGLKNKPTALAENTNELSSNYIDTSQIKMNQININSIDNLSQDKMNICLLVDDFVVMNKDELTQHFSTVIFPETPSDLKEWEDAAYGIYKRDGGTGEVYWDGQVINYSNEDFSRSINIEIEKGNLPSTCIANFYNLNEKSVINGVEVTIGQTDNGYYLVEFMHNNVGFRIIIKGLSQDELVSVISSLVR